MASLSEVKLTISHDHRKKLVTPKVVCKVNFSPIELCLMTNCPKHKMFKLRCSLWGEDGFLTGADDFLWNYSDIYYFPDASPTTPESRTFVVTLGEGVLDEDFGKDEVYGLLKLQNLFTGATLQKKTNVVSHYF